MIKGRGGRMGVGDGRIWAHKGKRRLGYLADKEDPMAVCERIHEGKQHCLLWWWWW